MKFILNNILDFLVKIKTFLNREAKFVGLKENFEEAV